MIRLLHFSKCNSLLSLINFVLIFLTAPLSAGTAASRSIDLMRADLLSKDPQIRAKAAFEMGNLPPDQALDVINDLVPLLSDCDNILWIYKGDSPAEEAARSLARIGTDTVVNAVSARLQKDLEARHWGMYTLARIKSKTALPVLAQILQEDGNESILARTIWTVGEIGCENGIRSIRGFLRHHADGVRAATALALGKLHCKPAIPEILEMVESDPCKVVKLAAAEALVNYSPFPMQYNSMLCTVLKHTADKQVKSHLISAVGNTGHPANAAVLTDFLYDKTLQLKTIWSLSRISGSGSVEALGGFIRKTCYSGLQGIALSALAESEFDAAVPFAMELLQTNSNSDLRRRAIRILGKSGTGHEILIALVEKEEEPLIRSEAALALGRSEEYRKEEVQILKNILNHDQSWAVRKAAVQALAHAATASAGTEVFDSLEAATADSHPLVRQIAEQKVRNLVH